MQIDPFPDNGSLKKLPIPQPSARRGSGAEVAPTPAPQAGRLPEPPHDVAVVEPGEYAVSAYRQRFFQGYAWHGYQNPMPNAGRFYIQNHEVTVGEFREYVNSLNAAERNELSLYWRQNLDGAPHADERPVDYVSWKQANHYAAWLRQRTGHPWRLPTIAEWITACLVLPAEREPVLSGRSDRPEAAQPKAASPGNPNLLANLREFSCDQRNLRDWGACAPTSVTAWQPCSTFEGPGHYLLGDNYMTAASDVGKRHCLVDGEPWPGVGFRLLYAEY